MIRSVPSNSQSVPSRTPELQVLLATFNGENYLEAQLASVFAQDWPSYAVLARDDGSSDATSSILERWQRETGRLHVLPSAGRLGPMRNFAGLMSASSAPYVAFCDQDDLWDATKLSVAMERMVEVERSVPPGTPVLVYSDLRLVDGSGVLLSPSLWQKARVRPVGASLGNMLAQNLVTGCAMLANRALLELSLPVPDTAIMHDYWLALVATAFGVASPIALQTLSYRQHAANNIGAGKALTLQERLHRIFVDPELQQWLPAAALQARTFGERYGKRLTATQAAALKTMASVVDRPAITRGATLALHGIVRTEALNQLQFLLRLTFGSPSPE